MIRIEKPWGYEKILFNVGKYVIKELGIREGCRISLQYHEIKHETWIIQSGEGWVRIDEKLSRYGFGDSDIFDIPPGTIHRVSSDKGLTRIIEISTPELDDVKRLEDDYERS